MNEPKIYVTFPALELRIPDVSERVVEGIVVPWGETSFLTPDPKGERFQPGSLTRTLANKAEKGQAVKLFRNHQHDQAVGRSIAWKPDHELGCWVAFRIGTGAVGDAILSEVAEGLLDAFSVGFQSVNSRRGADGAREVLQARLHEVSIAPIGAYDGARVMAMRTPVKLPELPPMPEVNLAPIPPLLH